MVTTRTGLPSRCLVAGYAFRDWPSFITVMGFNLLGDGITRLSSIQDSRGNVKHLTEMEEPNENYAIFRLS